MQSATKQHLSSKRGRPQGSFRDPALRAQAWHWLSELLLAAGETDARRLDDRHGAHRLSRSLPVGKRFTRVMEDGYDPKSIGAGTLQLFDHVKRQRKFTHACVAYSHPLFQYMQDRELGQARQLSWVQERLRTVGLTLLSTHDHMLGRAVGLMESEDWQVGEGQWTSDTDVTLTYLTDHPEEVASLDGLLLLVALHRLVIDTADREMELVSRVANLIRVAAEMLAARYRYGPEQRETWRFLVETRLVRWLPDFKASDAEISAALVQLGEGFKRTERSPRGRPKLGPDQVGRGRAERRWRRWAAVRAANARLKEGSFPWLLTGRTLASDWVQENSKHIERHLDQAWLRVMDVEDPSLREALPPLQMPAALFRMRHRSPTPDGAYDFYGFDVEAAVYDVINVECME